MFRFLLLFSLLIFSCNKSEEDECKPMPWIYTCHSSAEGVKCELTVSITINSRNTRVPIKIYEGRTIEEGTLIISDTLTSSKRYTLPEGDYAGQAEYQAFYEGQVLPSISIDRVDLSVETEEYCEDICYEGESKTIDLELSSLLQ